MSPRAQLVLYRVPMLRTSSFTVSAEDDGASVLIFALISVPGVRVWISISGSMIGFLSHRLSRSDGVTAGAVTPLQ